MEIGLLSHLLLLQVVEQGGQMVKLARNVLGEHLAVRTNDEIGWERPHLQHLLDSRLLLSRQVVVEIQDKQNSKKEDILLTISSII